MNVAFLMQDVGTMYGAQRATTDLVVRLQRSGEHVHILLIEEERLGLEKSDLRVALAAAGIPFTVLSTDRSFSPALARRIREAAGDIHARVVHTIGPKATLHGFLALRNSDIRLVSTVHGWLFRRDPKERFHEWLEQKILKRFDRVIVLSSYYQTTLHKMGFSPERVVRIPSGVDAESMVSIDEAKRSLSSAQPFTVGTIGRFSAEKNLEMLLRAARDVTARGGQTRFVMAGQGPERTKIEGLIHRFGLADVVRMPGYIPVEQFMRQIHVLVQCSLIENLPYSVLEAMAWCRPVVAADVGGLPDLVDEGKTGYLVKSNDHEALAIRLGEMAARPRLVEEMGLGGRRKLETEFGLAGQVERHRELYSEVIQG